MPICKLICLRVNYSLQGDRLLSAAFFLVMDGQIYRCIWLR
jgi:hypothetical protein